jgi:hypothetical protein
MILPVAEQTLGIARVLVLGEQCSCEVLGLRDLCGLDLVCSRQAGLLL